MISENVYFQVMLVSVCLARV